MSFGLLSSASALLPGLVGALFNFSVPTTVGSIRITNTGNGNRTVVLYLNYTGTAANPVDIVQASLSLAPYESVLLDGGPWNFSANSRISGYADVGNVVNIHVTPATI